MVASLNLTPDAPKVYRVRVLIVGGSTVGKSALVKALASKGTEFPKNYSLTIGVALESKVLQIEGTADSMEFLLLDSGGADIFQPFCAEVWPKDALACFVFDVTSKASFENLPKICEFVQEFTQKGAPGLLIANKVDLDTRRMVNQSVAKEFAQKQKLAYFECSAKDGRNVQTAFEALAKEWYQKQKGKR